MAKAEIRKDFLKIRNDFLKYVDSGMSTLEKDCGGYTFRYSVQFPNLKIKTNLKIKILKVEDMGGWRAIKMWRGEETDWMDINPSLEVRYNKYNIEKTLNRQ